MNTDTASTLRDLASEANRRGTASASPGAAGSLVLRVACAALFGAALLALGACASRDTTKSGLFEPYRTDLPQGNYLTREQVDQVREGMTRDQVRFALGTPLLEHVFHTDRWDYVFSFKHPNGRVELRKVTVRFENERVSGIEADPLPLRDDASDPALPGYRPDAARKEES